MIIFIVHFLERATREIVSKFVDTLVLLALVNTENLSANMENA